jgi:hypothetical protein
LGDPALSRAARRGILVLGMHRGGTSALTRVLNLIGARVPGNLAEPDRWNAKGYWESRDTIRIHDAMLEALGSRWDDDRPLPLDIDDPRLRPHRDELRGFLQANFAGVGDFVVKDPRICRFVPLWLWLLRDSRAAPHVALIVRNPVEVAASLRTRDLIPPSRSYSLWLRHVLEAERDSRGVPRGIVWYESLLNDWRTAVASLIAQLGLDWLPPTREDAASIDEFLSAELRHHMLDENEIGTLPEARWLSPTISALRAIAQSGDDPQCRQLLDAVYADCRANFAVLGGNAGTSHE